MFTQQQMSQLGAGGGGRTPRPGSGQVRSHQVNQLQYDWGGAAGRGDAQKHRLLDEPGFPASLHFQLIKPVGGGAGQYSCLVEDDPRLEGGWS